PLDAAGLCCQLPQSEINQAMVNFLKTFKPPVESSVTAIQPGTNAVDLTPTIQTQNEYSIRVDHNLRATDQLWFRYSWNRLRTTSPNGVPSMGSSSDLGNQNWGGGLVHVFSPATVLQAQFGRSHGDRLNKSFYRNPPGNFLQLTGYPEASTFMSALNSHILPGFNGGWSTGSIGVGPYPSLHDAWQARAV